MSESTVIDGIDYGPLAILVGRWEGDQGQDVAPEPDGTENNPFYETISFEAIGDVSNAESQVLVALRYLQVVRRKSNDKVFHDQTGYWMWDAASQLVMQSLTIPRAVCVLAGGTCTRGPDGSDTVFEVSADHDDSDWNIVQSPFMHSHARTLGFRHRLSCDGSRLEYSETTLLDIYGSVFEHSDSNTLTRRD